MVGRIYGESCGESVPGHRDAPASSSRESPSEARLRVVSGSGKHSIYTYFPKDKDCDICQRTKITRAPFRKRTGTVVPRAEKFGYLKTADQKVLSEGCEPRNNHRYAVVVQDLATQWIQSYPCKRKTSQETQRSLLKFLAPTRKPKLIYIDNYLEFGKACEDLSWYHCTSTPHRSETNGVAERAASTQNWWRDLCSTAVIRSGWQMEGGFHGVLLLSEEHTRSLVWWEDTLREAIRRTIQRTKNSIWCNGRISPCFCQRPVATASVRQESLTRYIPRHMYCTRVESEKETYWSQTLRNWKNMDASEIHAERLNAKEVSTPTNGTVKLNGEIRFWEHPP